MIAPALATRARGLATGLLDGAAIAAIESAASPGELAAALARAGYGPADRLDSADAIDRACAERASLDFEVLVRWAGDSAALAVAVGEQDRRNLRALVRGLVARATAERRRAAVVATPSMPAALVDELVAAMSAREIGRRLARAGHPLAAAIAGAAAEPVDLLELEIALAQAHAARLRAARASRAVAVEVAQIIDADNLGAAVALGAAPPGVDLDGGRCYIDGGARLDRGRYLAAIGGDRQGLARAFAGTPLAAAVDAAAPGALEDAALAWQLATQGALRRRRPLGAAPVLWLFARRRADHRLINRAAWRLALGGRR